MLKSIIVLVCLLVPVGLRGQDPATSANQTVPHKPHLIELTSDNWRPLSPKEKFGLFERDLLHWETHASILFGAGLSSALADRPYLGQGASGFFARYGLGVADESNFVFFNGFLFPTLCHQDPRYIPLDHGPTGRRLGYALTRVLVTRSDRGNPEFNESGLLGTLVATSISSAYYANLGGDISIGGNFANFGINLGTEAAFNLLKEFWPDAARKLKLNIWMRDTIRRALRDSIKTS